ncbi:MAG: response regulator [Planctomycetes bacterium]|nr:response regulator [Planctomycetota bacterium]
MLNTASYALQLRPTVWDSGTPRGTETILLVDDDVAVRRLYAISLRAVGYAVIEASNAAEAMQLRELHPAIQLLLSDLNMPGTGGLALSETMRALRPGIRVLLITRGDQGAESTADAELAADAFLQKPFTLTSLARQVRAVLDEGEQHAHWQE